MRDSRTDDSRSDSELNEAKLLKEIPDFYERVWECGMCQEKFTGRSIHEHVRMCRAGDWVRFDL